MKQCPQCQSTYTDETLRYCLADGTALIDWPEEATLVRSSGIYAAKTAVLGSPAPQIQINIPQPSEQTGFTASPPVTQQGSSSGGIFKIILIVIGLGILGLLALGIGGFIFYNASRSSDARNDVKTTPSPTPAKSDNDELRDQIANLEKRLNEQKKNGQPANLPVQIPNSGSTRQARVESPSDGFLALRSLPSSEAGDRVLKIPHGTVLTIGGCGPVTSAKRSGRWCQASYNGYSGYVFDAYLIY